MTTGCFDKLFELVKDDITKKHKYARWIPPKLKFAATLRFLSTRESYASLRFQSRTHRTQPTFQRRINVVSTLWINVKIMLIRRWKWNKIRRRTFNIAQRWCNAGVRRWNKVDKTLFRRCFNVSSALVKAISKPVRLVISTNL